MVVVLHGCTQTASGYNHSAGWSRLAEERGFALLFPEQRRANNPNLCFNWFSPRDSVRDSGEPLSIRQMVAALEVSHRIDPSRIFVTGLSAGGAMAAVMLATYPEVFAGGAVIAGLPYGIARSVPEALDLMRGHGILQDRRLAQRVRDASSHSGPWPTLSVWHGSADTTVSPSNGQALVDQWRTLHGLPEAPTATDTIDGYRRRSWRRADGATMIEDYLIAGMGHGTPLSTAGGTELAGPHMLEAGISSTRWIARFWGIDGAAAAAPAQPRAPAVQVRPRAAPSAEAGASGVTPAGNAVRKTIEDALRAAGLMR